MRPVSHGASDWSYRHRVRDDGVRAGSRAGPVRARRRSDAGSSTSCDAGAARAACSRRRGRPASPPRPGLPGVVLHAPGRERHARDRHDTGPDRSARDELRERRPRAPRDLPRRSRALFAERSGAPTRSTRSRCRGPARPDARPRRGGVDRAGDVVPRGAAAWRHAIPGTRRNSSRRIGAKWHRRAPRYVEDAAASGSSARADAMPVGRAVVAPDGTGRTEIARRRSRELLDARGTDAVRVSGRHDVERRRRHRDAGAVSSSSSTTRTCSDDPSRGAARGRRQQATRDSWSRSRRARPGGDDPLVAAIAR